MNAALFAGSRACPRRAGPAQRRLYARGMAMSLRPSRRSPAPAPAASPAPAAPRGAGKPGRSPAGNPTEKSPRTQARDGDEPAGSSLPRARVTRVRGRPGEQRGRPLADAP